LEGALASGQRAARQVEDLAAGKSAAPETKPTDAKPASLAPDAAPKATDEKKGFFSRMFSWMH